MRGAILAVLGCLTAASAAGQSVGSLNRTGSGARAAGMANAFIAVSDDGTAASWNPAGLAQLRRPEASVVVDTIARAFDFSGFLTPDNRARYGDRHSRVTTSGLDFVSLAVPFDLAGKPVTFQGGWRRLYELRAEIQADFTREPVLPDGPASLRLQQDNDVRGNIDLWSLSAAARLSQRVSAGLSVDLWRGDWTGSELRVQQVVGQPAAEFRTRQQRSRMSGANVSAGLLLSYARGQVGLVYHAPFDSRFDEQAQELGPRGGSGLLTTSDGTRLAFGHSLGLGGALRVRPRLTLALDFTWDQWSAAELRGYPGTAQPVSFFDQRPRALTSTRDTLSLNLGAEWLLTRPSYVVPLRAGLAYEPQGGMDPILRDPLDYVMLAAGAGFNTNRFKFDAALQYRFGRQRVSEALTLEGVPLYFPDAYGVLRTGEWRFKVSGILRVTEDGAVGRLLGKIF
jgi:long-subunit fatty acid transport protein